MDNYFNYFTEIEEHFQNRRGKATLLSPLDWSLIESFQQAGISVETVLRGIDQAFEKFEARKSRARQINSLAYCTQAVLAEHDRQKENSVGRAKVDKDYADDSKDRLDLMSLIANACDRLEQTVIKLSAHPSSSPIQVLEHVRTSLLDIQRELAKKNRWDYEDLELRLGMMEEKIFASLVATLSDEALLALRSEVNQEIGKHKRGLKAEHVAMLERKILTQKLFDRFGVPRLSLFYLPLN